MNYIGELLQPIRKATARNLADHEARVLRLREYSLRLHILC